MGKHKPKLLSLSFTKRHILLYTTVFFLFAPFIKMPLKAYAQSWNDYDSLRVSFSNTQQWDSAEVYTAEMIEYVKKNFGKQDTLYAYSLRKMFEIQYHKRNYTKAIEIGEKEREVRKLIQGKKHPEYASICFSLGDLYRALGDFTNALDRHTEAKNIRKEIFGERHIEYANSCNNLGLVKFILGNYPEAQRMYNIAKEIREELLGVDHPAYATTNQYLAILYETLGRYSEAMESYLIAKNIRENYYGKDHSEYAAICHNFASLNWKLGYYETAISLYLDAKAVYEKTIGREHVHYANTTDNLGILYYQTGNYALAEMLYKEAIDIRSKLLGENHPDYAMSLNNLAILYLSLANYSEAESIYKQVLTIIENSLGKDHHHYATSCNNLAAFYITTKQYEQALPLSIEAKDVRESIFGKDHVSYASSCRNLADVYMHMEKHELALELLLESLEIFEKTVGKNHPSYADICKFLGISYHNVKDYDKALFYLSLENEILESVFGEVHDRYANNLINISHIYYDMGDNTMVEESLTSALSIKNNIITQNFSFLSEDEKEKYFVNQESSYAYFYSFALNHFEINPEISIEVFNYVIRNKGLLLKSSTAMRNAIYNSNDTVLIEILSEWIEMKKEIANLYSIEVSERDTIVSLLEQEANEIEKELVRRSQAFSDFDRLLNIEWNDIKDNLKEKEAAIEFIHFKNYAKNDSVYYAALIIKQNSQYPEMLGLFYENELQSIIQAIAENDFHRVEKIYGKNENPNLALYKLIWTPLENALQEVETVYLSPSGLLHKISFSAIAKEKDVYLCDIYNLNNLSGTLKLALSDDINIDNHFTAYLFGGINYSNEDVENEVWKYLDGTKQEVKSIKTIFNEQNIEAKAFKEFEATEDLFKEKAQEGNILHIATHGFFYPDPNDASAFISDAIIEGEVEFRGSPTGYGAIQFMNNPNPLMRSGLTFAGANRVWSDYYPDVAEDGVLTALEVINLDLRNTHLVVLSACETGLGDIKGSEGVYGLQRAFKMAGVKYLIMSLWQVPDKETVEFMEGFYSNLLDNKNIRTSFNKTQKEMRQKYDPFYWAAFVLVE